VGSGETVKEAILEVISWLSKHEGASVRDAIESFMPFTSLRDETQEMIRVLSL